MSTTETDLAAIHPVLITRWSASDGSMSRSRRFCKPAHAVEEAARHLLAAESGEEYMAGRTMTLEIAQARRFESPVNLGLFDRAAQASGGFMTGNVVSDIQLSQYIRPHTLRQCNGFVFPDGALRASDLKTFDSHCGSGGDQVPMLLLSAIRERPQESLIGYKVFHPASELDGLGRRRRIVHGWVLTSAEGDLVCAVNGNGAGWRRHCWATDEIMRRAIDTFTHACVPGSKQTLLAASRGTIVEVAPAVEASAQRIRDAGQLRMSAPRG